jgi:hypothetical protein
LGAFKNKIDTNYGSEIRNYGTKNYGKEIPFLLYPYYGSNPEALKITKAIKISPKYLIIPNIHEYEITI